MDYIKENFVGKWKVDKSEGFEDFLKEMGVNLVVRKMASLSKPVTTISIEDGDKIRICTVTPVRTMDDVYKLDGQSFEKEIDGNKMKCLCTFEDKKLKMTLDPIDPSKNIKPQTVIRELDGDQLLATIFVGDVICKRWHNKLED